MKVQIVAWTTLGNGRDACCHYHRSHRSARECLKKEGRSIFAVDQDWTIRYPDTLEPVLGSEGVIRLKPRGGRLKYDDEKPRIRLETLRSGKWRAIGNKRQRTAATSDLALLRLWDSGL